MSIKNASMKIVNNFFVFNKIHMNFDRCHIKLITRLTAWKNISFSLHVFSTKGVCTFCTCVACATFLRLCQSKKSNLHAKVDLQFEILMIFKKLIEMKAQ